MQVSVFTSIWESGFHKGAAEAAKGLVEDGILNSFGRWKLRKLGDGKKRIEKVLKICKK